MIYAEITPRFDVRAIVLEAIEIPFVTLEGEITDLAVTMLSYLQTYINSHSQKGHTGNLANSMKIDYFLQTQGELPSRGWGIGHKLYLEVFAPYWYLINYGGSSFKGEYHFVPGFFNGNKFVYNPMIAEGKSLPSGVKGYIIPMNYIEASKNELDRQINQIIQSLKTETNTGWGRGSGGAR